jgi:hypothetical protein
MAGRGPAPKANRLRRAAPIRGEYRAASGAGWQYGPIPKAPGGLTAASRAAWSAWFSGWVAAHWTPADLPGLWVLVRLYDQVERGEYRFAGELRLWMDTYGVSPKGAQDRRWIRPPDPEPPPPPGRGSAYAHLQVVDVDREERRGPLI